MKFFSKSSQTTAADRAKVNKDYYEFNKTVSHGFPANPTCLAYDNVHKLLAIGTKSGSIQIYGKPGVEFHYEFEEEVEVSKLIFVPRKGQVVCLCSDSTFYLLQITLQNDHLGLQRLNTNEYFVNENDSCPPDKVITTISLSSKDDLLYVGLKSGDIQILNIATFQVSDDIIKQEQILKSIEEELKFKPGPVEVIAEQPNNPKKLLIGYNRCLIAFWDFENQSIKNYFIIEQRLESLSWNKNENEFISSHNDGSYITWSVNQERHNLNLDSKLPYGPFPCKAIQKICWDKTPNGEFFIFSGGMPRASYSDKETVSIIFYNSENVNHEKNHVLDFTSKVIDFLIIYSEDNIPEALVALVVEEIVVIDLKHPDWLQFKLPYLSCLHSSPITCSHHCSNVTSSIYQKIVSSGQESPIKYSGNEWPITGGISKYQGSEEKYDMLITGHEDGTVRFWDASTTSLKHLYTLSTSKLFNLNEDDIALIDSDESGLNNEEHNEWPPFKKVGNFDPYSDDPRLAIRKISFCTDKGTLAIGGTAGQLIVFELTDQSTECNVVRTEIKIIDDKDGFVWKGHTSLPVRSVSLKTNPGFHYTSLVQLHPPAAITALVISSTWQVIGIGTAHGFALWDYHQKKGLVSKTTLKASNLSAAAGGDALISRRKSFKKSLRESFRRLRRSRSQKSKRNVQSSANPSRLQELNKNTKFDDLDTRPVERQIEARTEDMMSSMVRYLYFCSSVVINNALYPTFWIGTNSGTVFIYVLTSDKSANNEVTWQLAKEVQLKHKAPIIFIRLINQNGEPIFEENTWDNEKSTSRVLICSEEQFKLFSLPNFKTLHKFKLTAHEGVRVRKMEVAQFISKSNDNQSEYSLMFLTNHGDVNVFSFHDFKRKLQSRCIKKEDINGISSLVFTKYGEGFYLKSSSEYQRFSLSSKRINFPECFIQLPKETKAALEETNLDESGEEEEEKVNPVVETNENEVKNLSESDVFESDLDTTVLNDASETLDAALVEDVKVKNGGSKINPNGSAVISDES